MPASGMGEAWTVPGVLTQSLRMLTPGLVDIYIQYALYIFNMHIYIYIKVYIIVYYKEYKTVLNDDDDDDNVSLLFTCFIMN